MRFACLSQACAPLCGSTMFFSLLATQVHSAVGVQRAGGERSRTDVSQTVHLGCARVRLRSSRVLCTQRQPLFASQGGAASATYGFRARATGFTRCSDRQPAATLAAGVHILTLASRVLGPLLRCYGGGQTSTPGHWTVCGCRLGYPETGQARGRVVVRCARLCAALKNCLRCEGNFHAGKEINWSRFYLSTLVHGTNAHLSHFKPALTCSGLADHKAGQYLV